MMEEEDRISNLPDDIIHRILSFLDLKYAMQTSALSKKWKLVWTLLPQLNLDSYNFSTPFHFNNFVEHALLHHNHHREFSVLELRYRGEATEPTVKSIVKYAGLHNVRRLTLVWSGRKHQQFPRFLFDFRALKDLTLAFEDRSSGLNKCCLLESFWDFPALEKLNLKNFQLGNPNKKRINLFSKCVNLKDLTLCEIRMHGLVELTLCLPQLCNLTITSSYYQVLNVVAPQLQNLTACFGSIQGLHCWDLLHKSVEGFSFLEKVNLSWKNTYYPYIENETLGVFQKLYSAKFLILDANIIRVLSSRLDLLLVEPCPFNNLKCVKMNTMLETQKHVVVPVQLKNYFLDKSPTATFIIDYPQVPQKRCSQQVHDDDDDGGAKKIAKLDLQKKNQLILL